MHIPYLRRYSILLSKLVEMKRKMSLSSMRHIFYFKRTRLKKIGKPLGIAPEEVIVPSIQQKFFKFRLKQTRCDGLNWESDTESDTRTYESPSFRSFPPCACVDANLDPIRRMKVFELPFFAYSFLERCDVYSFMSAVSLLSAFIMQSLGHSIDANLLHRTSVHPTIS